MLNPRGIYFLNNGHSTDFHIDFLAGTIMTDSDDDSVLACGYTGRCIVTGSWQPVAADAVPEPQSLALIASGLIGTGWVRRRRRTKGNTA